MCFIYALADPRTDAVAYVGITDNAYERFKQHINYRGNNGKKDAWIQQLKNEKMIPSMKILEIVENRDIALVREEYWIYYYRMQGVQLVNTQLNQGEIRPPNMLQPNISKFVFSPSTPNDSWAEVKIGTQLYGEDDIVPFKRLLEWREINSEIYMSLKEHGKVISYSSLMPLEEEIILTLLQDKIRERDIPDSAIRQWTDPQLSIYIASVTVNPTGDKEIDTKRGWMIIKHTLKWALSLDRHFNIANWYGIGATKEGQKLFEELGFTPIVSLYDGERKGYKIRDIKQPVRIITKLIETMDLPDVNEET